MVTTAGRRRRYDDPAVRAALDAQWQRLLPALAAAEPAAPTRLPGWDVRRLAAHLTGTLTRLAAAVARPAPRRAALTLAGYYAADRPAPDPQPAPAEALAAVSAALAGVAPDRLVTVGEGDLRLTDYLVTRVVEAVVHGRDLPDPVEPDAAALRIAVQALADLLADRHPGRTVELRVPPYVAVQCVAGPVHTRGTPPGVVECEPLAWTDVAAGRLPWPTAVAAGRISASGTRADLSAYLPLL